MIDAETVIGPSALIPIGVVLGIVSIAVGAYAWLATRFNRIENRLDRLDGHNAETWSVQDMRVWALKLNRMNSELEVPEVESSDESRRR